MNELTYTMQGDYNLPDLTMPKQPEVTLGRYAQMRRKFLKEHHKIRYYSLLTSCTLTQHLAEVEQTAMKLEETLMKQMAAQEGLTESLKAADMMKWVQRMNNLRNRVQEIVKLIRLDRYLNPKEKEIYPQWLEKQEERRAELAEEQKNREILSSAPPKQESVQAAESEPQQEAQYAYHLGDTVYMGADEYEILAFDDKRVVLHDMQYPLFQKELERDEFDRRVRENPMNDHLKVMNQAAVAEQQPRFNSIEFEKLIPHHMRFKETDLVRPSRKSMRN